MFIRVLRFRLRQPVSPRSLTGSSSLRSSTFRFAWAFGASLSSALDNSKHFPVAKDKKEPLWHRKLRRSRQLARSTLNFLSTQRIGKKRKQRIARLVPILRQHHSWHFHSLPLPTRQLLKRMTWSCQKCRCNNSEALEHCRQCQGHWEAVWSAPKRRRSASQKYRGKKAETTDPKNSEKTKDKTPQPKETDVFRGQLTIFSEALPWVTSTPQSRLPRRIDNAPTQEETAMPLPPNPVLPAPPGSTSSLETVQPLSPEEQKMMGALQALKELQAPLSEDMANMLSVLEHRNKEAQPTTLSHSQLNRLTKLKGQVTSLQKRLITLDAEWGRFIQGILTSTTEHAQMYQACRQEMVTNYQNKLQELQALKQAITEASHSLCAPAQTEALPETVGDIEEAMETLQQLAQGHSHVEFIDDDMESEELQEEKPAVPSAIRAKSNFRASTSPNRVAHVHLKPGETGRKGRPKETKTKEDTA